MNAGDLKPGIIVRGPVLPEPIEVDGDPARFRLGVEAARLGLAY